MFDWIPIAFWSETSRLLCGALWYWSIDAGGPHLRRTAQARRPDFLFSQQRHEVTGWDRWVPGFHDYLHAAFVISLTFHSAGACAAEMVTATVFTVAARLGLDAASVLIVSDRLPSRRRIGAEALAEAEQRAGALAAAALS